MAARNLLLGMALMTSTCLGVPPSRCFVEVYVIDTGGGVEPYGISADGTVVVGLARTQNAGPTRAFRWTIGGGAEFLRTRNGEIENPAWGISSDGLVIVGKNGVTPFAWRSSTDVIDLGFLDPDDRRGTARAANLDGSVIVGSSPDRPSRAFRWTKGSGMIELPNPLGEGIVQAWDVSDDGLAIAGTLSGDSGGRAAIWEEGQGWSLLDPLQGEEDGRSSALVIRRDGEAILGAANDTVNGEVEAFLWTSDGGSMSLGDLAPPGQYNSFPRDMSDDGGVVIGFQRDLGPFLWTPEDGMRFLRNVLTDDYAADMSEFVLWEPTAISADGKVIALTGQIDSRNYTIGLVIRIPPDCPVDYTTTGNPNDPLYGVPNGIVDSNDFFFYLDAFADDRELADLTGNGYCMPDGIIDSDDFFLFLDLFVFGCRP